ncbi:MAG TPA: hypothetical protein VM487_10785, partial [Phycisphaerae bacterium]|nr:hypothetical protein [Phycisphaerae bacterium]
MAVTGGEPISTVAGGGSGGDGGAATSAQLKLPADVAVDAAGNLYIAEFDNHRVRKVDAATQEITTVAGTGAPGFGGDGGPATSAQLNNPIGVAVDTAGNLYISGLGDHRVRKVDAENQKITTVTGTGTAGSGGDNAAATLAQLKLPADVAVDAAGNLYIAEFDNHRVRKVDAVTQEITTVAGTGVPGFGGDDGLATLAQLNNPVGVTVDALGNL